LLEGLMAPRRGEHVVEGVLSKGQGLPAVVDFADGSGSSQGSAVLPPRRWRWRA
jgi:hypothetical protein